MKTTLSIDEEIVIKVRKIATDKNTTLTAMMRDYLTSISSSESAARRPDADKFLKTFKKVSRDMGTRTWSREDLYDRPRRHHG